MFRSSMMVVKPPAQRQAEVLGTLTHAQLVNCVTFAGIDSGQRQLIIVTCIAEHAHAATYTNANALAKPQANRARCRALQESESGGY